MGQEVSTYQDFSTDDPLIQIDHEVYIGGTHHLTLEIVQKYKIGAVLSFGPTPIDYLPSVCDYLHISLAKQTPQSTTQKLTTSITYVKNAKKNSVPILIIKDFSDQTPFFLISYLMATVPLSFEDANTLVFSKLTLLPLTEHHTTYFHSFPLRL
ncbi:hypothetical protein EIN_053930 [Entamoeba invadens IP1]|uniref:hypothetical protein n=1 Tax=Entamoeba invadens IP1 TaxID=370355 RepID=UPI0002C3DF9C|nr:hypothetical protein EIN_053930 [Entamoeba invadens IP1]ELP93128.1 hypothetical protein EIN_053930 [Entamoeba invadens IP1]|eukprot:XP_004259899.1 hypothetical protein EIN_053930 [Entamoeba invadens IP1]